MENRFLKWLSSETQSVYWHDSAIRAEQLEGFSNGAVGMTTNPFLVNQTLAKDTSFWADALAKLPKGLKGDEIPLGARIIRVCDVFAALTTDRPYRRRFDADEAVRLMIDEIRHFDLKIFLAFERVIHRVGTKYRVHISAGDEEIIRLFGDAALEGGPEDETCGKDPDEEERVLHESDTAPFII